MSQSVDLPKKSVLTYESRCSDSKVILSRWCQRPSWIWSTVKKNPGIVL